MKPAANDPPSGEDSVLDAGRRLPAGGHGEPLARWMGWRLRLLVGAALLGCAVVFLVARAIAGLPQIDARWQATANGGIELVSSPLPALARHAGDVLQVVTGAASTTAPLDALALERSPRWIADDAARARHGRQHQALAAARAEPPLTLGFADGSAVEVDPTPRGFAGLGLVFWLVAGVALALYLVGMVVLLGQPGERNLLYALMAVCQAGSLLFVAAESTLALALPPLLVRWEMPLRTAFDMLTAAATVHAAAIHPQRLPGARGIALASWGGAAALGAALTVGGSAPAWWWTQGWLFGCGVAALALFTWSYRRVPHPSALVLRRFALLVIAGGALLTLVVAASARLPGADHTLVATGTTVWQVFVASLLLLLPFLSKPQHVVREFALLASVTTVATSLDLLFVAVFSLGQFASLTLSLFFTLGVYVGTRQWILNQLLGSQTLTAERMFARLYRTVREIEKRPQDMPGHVCGLLRDLFEPIEIDLVGLRRAHARASSEGSTLLVPLPRMPEPQNAAPDDAGADAHAGAVLMRFAQRGRRLFTSDDARLADRIVEQLRRALTFDRAVEQGRTEERLRLAQDLHDDIGARLLTLMYQAQSPEVEDYLRHTLLDLKTLTRGLAAPTHRLSDAAAEWKADLTQRCTLAQVALDWKLGHDRDVTLTVVQWSALTRVLRELASNVIAHAQARRLEVELRLVGERLELTVTDDGSGRDPAAWSHGLGLGGVRKRVKQLGGEVEWREVQPRGIRCRVTVARF